MQEEEYSSTVPPRRERETEAHQAKNVDHHHPTGVGTRRKTRVTEAVHDSFQGVVMAEEEAEEAERRKAQRSPFFLSLSRASFLVSPLPSSASPTTVSTTVDHALLCYRVFHHLPCCPSMNPTGNPKEHSSQKKTDDHHRMQQRSAASNVHTESTTLTQRTLLKEGERKEKGERQALSNEKERLQDIKIGGVRKKWFSPWRFCGFWMVARLSSYVSKTWWDMPFPQPSSSSSSSFSVFPSFDASVAASEWGCVPSSICRSFRYQSAVVRHHDDFLSHLQDHHDREKGREGNPRRKRSQEMVTRECMKERVRKVRACWRQEESVSDDNKTNYAEKQYAGKAIGEKDAARRREEEEKEKKKNVADPSCVIELPMEEEEVTWMDAFPSPQENASSFSSFSRQAVEWLGFIPHEKEQQKRTVASTTTTTTTALPLSSSSSTFSTSFHFFLPFLRPLLYVWKNLFEYYHPHPFCFSTWKYFSCSFGDTNRQTSPTKRLPKANTPVKRFPSHPSFSSSSSSRRFSWNMLYQCPPERPLELLFMSSSSSSSTSFPSAFSFWKKRSERDERGGEKETSWYRRALPFVQWLSPTRLPLFSPSKDTVDHFAFENAYFENLYFDCFQFYHENDMVPHT